MQVPLKNSKLLLKKSMIFCLFALLCISAIAQKNAIRQISGVVTDELGESLIGVSVVVKGTATATVTDVNGRFSIEVSNEKPVLVFSYIGYVNKEVVTGTQTLINVSLKESSLDLDEIVVIGYGTQRRRDLTGSVVSVNVEQLKNIPVISASQAITGKLAGVQVTQTEGSPDAEIKIRVRGGGSLTQDNSPLFIVDGFPVDDINDISPTDIASIDVLKDASSTAIYGARGANGVVIIATKSGFEGKAKVSYNMYFGLKKVTDYLDVLDPYEYVYWQWEAQQQTGTGNFPRYYGSFEDMDLYKEMTGTNWQKKIFGRVGTSLSNSLSVSGGNKSVKYNVSLVRNDDKDIMLETEYNRTNLTSNTSFVVNKWISFNFNVRLSDYKLTGAGTTNTTFPRMPHIVQYRPVNGLMDFVDDGMVDPEDYETVSSSIIDPLRQTIDDYRFTNRQTFNYNSTMSIKFFPTLTYRFDFGYQYLKKNIDRFYGLNTSNAITYGSQPIASIEKNEGYSYRAANTLTYSKRNLIRRGHNVTALVGQEASVNKDKSLIISAKGFPKYISRISALSMMQMGKADPVETADNPGSKLLSFFGRVNYDYMGRYLVAATFRADGSSKFAPGNQWGYFPAASGAWRISDESFMESTSDWLSNLKLRASYGEAGNNRISDDAWRKIFAMNADNLFLTGEDTPTSYLQSEGVLSNPELKWETTITRNLGIDFGFFNQRLSGSLELYKNTTKDLLLSATLPSNSGYRRQWQNIGQTSNRGIEFSLESVIFQEKDFDLSASFNIAFNKNRIDKLGENKRWEQSSGWTNDSDGPTGDYLIEEGGKIGLMYGFVTDGMYTFDDFDYTDGEYVLKPGVADNHNLIMPRLFRPGVLKFVDQNKDDVVDAANDKVVIGDANPLHTGGFNVSARYKGLDLSVFFNWVYGNDLYNANKLAFTDLRSGRVYKNLLSIMNSENRFTYFDKTTGLRVDDPEQLEAMNKNATIWQAANSLTRLHSWAVEDGSFLRLNNLTIGYSFPKGLLYKFHLEQLRVYVTGYNLWLWTNYSGFDPEVDAVRKNGPLTPGIDYSAYPRSRTFNFGLNLTF
jgi:TonB-linked SusC/RagA family outer membrane protein